MAKSTKQKQKLEILFDLVKEKSYVMRKSQPTTFDGKGFWQPIKNLLDPLDNAYVSNWKPLSKTKTRQIMLLPEYTINGYEEKQINELNHFIIQQVRIPLTEKATVKKIIQIALNIGQYKGINNGVYIHDIRFENLDEFLTKKEIIEMSKHIPNNIVEQIKVLLI